MAEQQPLSFPHTTFHTGAHVNPPNSTHLRQRPLGRSATFAESTSNPPIFRPNSIFSDSVSEARQSIQSSTDDLLFPRARRGADATLHYEESHWHSAPLALALLPAIGGLFFQNGSAFVTDATLLVLAAIFLNWSVRLPWDWYRSAQETRQQAPEEYTTDDIIDEEDEGKDEEMQDNGTGETPQPHRQRSKKQSQPSATARAATRELHIHELAALLSCFIFPLLGTWLLHAIRGSLSRPSEGLVSNYNLTIFLLAAEIRPFAHLLRMVHCRTLYLQRIVAVSPFEDDSFDKNKLIDLAKRLEEVEGHVADAATARDSTDSTDTTQKAPQNIVAHVTADVRRGFQPELDALNRAVRRYEKRTTLMAFQTDSRLQELETQVRDAIALAAAAQRSATDRHQSFALILLDWICAVIVVPAQTLFSLFSLPTRIASWCLQNLKVLLGIKIRRSKASKAKRPQGRSSLSPRPQRRSSPASPTWSGKEVKKST